MVKLFELDESGLLHEVPAEQAEALRASRSFRHVAIGAIEVLLTPAEEAEREAESARATAEREATEAELAAQKAAAAERRFAAEAKLAALGLTPEDIEALKA